MAMKAMLLILACLLLVTVRVSSTEGEYGTEHHHDYKALAPGPEKPHHHHDHHPHVDAPEPHHNYHDDDHHYHHHPPADAPEPHHNYHDDDHHHHHHRPPADAPEPHHYHHDDDPHHHGCFGRCLKYCAEKPMKRRCERVCTKCCHKFKCVPLKENLCQAPSWGHIMYHGEQVKCP